MHRCTVLAILISFFNFETASLAYSGIHFASNDSLSVEEIWWHETKYLGIEKEKFRAF